MTSGELFLLHLLKYQGKLVINEPDLLIAGSDNPLYSDDSGMRADLSRISNVTYRDRYGNTQTYNVNGDNTNTRFITTNGSFGSPIISFTTTDGKVHTADNLNY